MTIMASVIAVGTLCQGCMPLVPDHLTLRIPDGYRGPIAILPTKSPEEGAVYPEEITIPPNGIFVSPMTQTMPEYYTLSVVYQSGARIPLEAEDALPWVVAFRGEGEGRVNDGPLVSHAFIGTDQEFAEFDWHTWMSSVNEHYDNIDRDPAGTPSE